uniref:Uncharacterized protein n=1 Tax=Glossina pallidipes TaxID=7398 RepID=A0A1B0A4M4_GLOPL
MKKVTEGFKRGDKKKIFETTESAGAQPRAVILSPAARWHRLARHYVWPVDTVDLNKHHKAAADDVLTYGQLAPSTSGKPCKATDAGNICPSWYPQIGMSTAKFLEKSIILFHHDVMMLDGKLCLKNFDIHHQQTPLLSISSLLSESRCGSQQLQKRSANDDRSFSCPAEIINVAVRTGDRIAVKLALLFSELIFIHNS